MLKIFTQLIVESKSKVGREYSWVLLTSLSYDYMKLIVDNAYKIRNDSKLGVNQEEVAVCEEVA